MRQPAPATADPAPLLVGRERERGRIAAFVEAVPHGARALVLRGEPGIGKTALWREGVRECERAGAAVLLSRLAEEEMPLGMTGLVDLFEHAELDSGPLAAADSPFARGRAVLTALRDLSRTAPVVIAIDDLQWLDHASGRALRYALRRLDAEPVGVLATLRDGDDPLEVSASLPPGRTEVLAVGPLGPDALRRLLTPVVESISRPMLQRIHAVSGGNPLYALELARGLAGDHGPHPGGLPLPQSLRAAIAERLDTVSAEVSELLQAVSALGHTSVRELRAALPGADVADLLAAAERCGLLVVEEDLRVRFAHPLVGSVVYGTMGPLVRRALHARLAAAADDPDVRARHLALCTDEPDASVARRLEDAADRARARDAFDLAADFAGHSARLTPPEDAASVLRRRLAEIDDCAIAGEASRALSLADRLVATLPPGPARCEALLERAYVQDDDIGASVEDLRRAVADSGDDTQLRGRVLDMLGWVLGMHAGDLPSGLEVARAAMALADDPQLEMSFAATLAYLEALGGAPRPELMARALTLEREVSNPLLWTSPRTYEAETRLWAGDLPGARALFEAVRDDSERAGTATHHPYSMFDLALVDCAAGDFAAAGARVEEGMQAARDAEDRWAERLLLYPLSLVEAWRGHAEAARAAAQRRLEQALGKGEQPGVVRARGVLGLLALSEGDHATAARELSQAASLLDAMGYGHPGAFPILPDAVEALACAGHLAGAEALLDRLERQAAAVSSDWARAAAQRARGALMLVRGRAEPAAGTLARAAAVLDRLGHRPDAARALHLQGRALLRAGQRAQAAEALAAARDRFVTLGAPLWEARAAEELERAAPGRASGTLTPAERRIAALVADGKRNREISQTLFMSVATVEAHLTRTYRKLGIRSRSELARRVTEGDL